MYLIERLEAERQYAEEALHKERKRKRFLESQVDGISLWKQQERSQVVQKGRWRHLRPHFYVSKRLILRCCRPRAWGMPSRHCRAEAAAESGATRTRPSSGEACAEWGAQPAPARRHQLHQKANSHRERKPWTPERSHQSNTDRTIRGTSCLTVVVCSVEAIVSLSFQFIRAHYY